MKREGNRLKNTLDKEFIEQIWTKGNQIDQRKGKGKRMQEKIKEY